MMQFRSRWNLGLLVMLIGLAVVVVGYADEAHGAGGVAGENLLPTPKFDEINPGTGLPVGWARFAGHVGENVWITDEEVYQGAYSYKGIQTEAASVGMRTARMPVRAGETYELTAWVKTRDGGRAWIGIETYETENSGRIQLVNSNTEAPDWTELKVEFTVPEGVNYIDAIIYTLTTNRGTMYWNSPSLVKSN